jgi:2-dehydro-3-deoxyphosphogluconate aldolase/(4S)-4-hydroxy-2-oxoglutarate aldolase
MNESIEAKLGRCPVVPLVVPTAPDTAVRVTRALLAGGLGVVEVVLRTDAALECLAAVAEAVPEAMVGAGTVLSAEQVRKAADAGAQFIVSPGLHEAVVKESLARDLPVFPGIATATEAQVAWNLGLRALKFFPASLAGGPAMIKALGSVFRDVVFMPTGGVSAANLGDYLALPNVLACGGSWLTPKAAIADGDFQQITDLAAEAVAIARESRG